MLVNKNKSLLCNSREYCADWDVQRVISVSKVGEQSGFAGAVVSVRRVEELGEHGEVGLLEQRPAHEQFAVAARDQGQQNDGPQRDRHHRQQQQRTEKRISHIHERSSWDRKHADGIWQNTNEEQEGANI